VMYFETHAHFDDSRFDEDRDQIINDAHAAGVDVIINIGSTMNTSKASVLLAQRFDFVFASVGVHPHDAKSMNIPKFEALKVMANDPKVVAIGEIGLDYYYDHSERDVQREWFKRQLDFAIEADLPVIIHNRDAHEDTYDMLFAGCADARAQGKTLRGVIHCYSGSAEMALRFLKLGFYIAFGGAITFKNAHKSHEAIAVIPFDRLLIETDCPYLAPEPFRGKRNNSAYLCYVVEKMAQILDKSPEEVARQTYENAVALFGIGQKKDGIE